jgi:hypothetical protein
MKDWTGNSQAVHAVNQRGRDVAEHDYYATHPLAVELLLEQEQFDTNIWEPACGAGHISEVLKAHGYQVLSSDLIERGYGEMRFDFLSTTTVWRGDIITNPPYKYAREFVEVAMEHIGEGRKVAMFLKLTFLEGQARRELFRKYPPRTVYVSSARLNCGKNGNFDEAPGAVAYCWIVWEKGYGGPPQLKWIN